MPHFQIHDISKASKSVIMVTPIRIKLTTKKVNNLRPCSLRFAWIKRLICMGTFILFVFFYIF